MCWNQRCHRPDRGRIVDASLKVSTSTNPAGPGKGALAVGHRILAILVSMVEMRLRLAVIELEEEKERLIHLIIMAGMTLLFAAFGLMCLLGLLFLAIDPSYRLQALTITTAVLLGLALIIGILTIAKVRHSTFLKATRDQLMQDRALLEKRK